MTESYHCLDDLRQFGIYGLTGEACGVGMRVLCDVDKNGKELLEEYLRVSLTSEPWNSSTDGKDHVASVMLTPNMFQDIWIFAHLRKGTRHVFLGGYVNDDRWTETHYESLNTTHRHPVDSWHPCAYATNDDEHMNLWKEANYFYISRVFRTSKAPGTGLDNQHAMSGRIS